MYVAVVIDSCHYENTQPRELSDPKRLLVETVKTCLINRRTTHSLRN